MSNELETQIDDDLLRDKVLNFFKKNKIKVFLLMFLLIVLPISLQVFLFYKDKKQEEFISRYIEAEILINNNDKKGIQILNTIKEKGSSTDGIFELLKLEPEFAGITIEPSAASEITDTDINNERRLELEIEMLDIIHSGESTVDVTGNGYEAFNQGGSNEGKTVEGFSGTYGDHQANTGKKLTEMTIKDILANQDSGYNTKLYPFTKEGTEKWHKSGGIHAAGRYQFTRVGLREALKRSDLKETDLFSEINQDKLAMILLTQIGSKSMDKYGR